MTAWAPATRERLLHRWKAVDEPFEYLGLVIRWVSLCGRRFESEARVPCSGKKCDECEARGPE
jgi:hypothetical protein